MKLGNWIKQNKHIEKTGGALFVYAEPEPERPNDCQPVTRGDLKQYPLLLEADIVREQAGEYVYSDVSLITGEFGPDRKGESRTAYIDRDQWAIATGRLPKEKPRRRRGRKPFTL